MMAARQTPAPKRYRREDEVHVQLTPTEMTQLRQLSAVHGVPMTKLVRARLRLPLDLERIEREHGRELARKMQWRLIADEPPLPPSSYRRPS